MLSLLRKTPEQEATRVEEDLQELMLYLIRYGRPRLSYLDGGWYCKVEMNTNTKGTQFDIASEFNHSTPMSAAKQCHERITNALKALTQ
jgi:hypothetical protein